MCELLVAKNMTWIMQRPQHAQMNNQMCFTVDGQGQFLFA